MRSPPDPEKTNPLTPDCLAAEGAGDGDRNLAARLGRYGTGKTRSHQMAGYCLDQGERAISRRLYTCASVLRFREWIEHDSKITLHSGHFCQVPLLCPVCAIRRGGKLLRRYVERAQYLQREHDLWLVTLTVKNGPDLFERFLHLKHSIKRLRTRARDGYGEFSRAAGALWSTEFTHDPATGWHPHVHMVWAMPKGSDPIYWGQGSRLAADWLAITGDSFIVNAKRIGAQDREGVPLAGKGPGAGATAANPLIDAFCEVLKYALKFSSLTLEDNFHAWRHLKGNRLISSCGVWWGLDLPEDAKLEDDPLDGPYIEHLYRYAGSRGYVLDSVDSGVMPALSRSLVDRNSGGGHEVGGVKPLRGASREAGEGVQPPVDAALRQTRQPEKSTPLEAQ